MDISMFSITKTPPVALPVIRSPVPSRVMVLPPPSALK